MTIAFVQKSTLAQTSSFAASLQSNALSSNPTVGNYLVAWFWGTLSNNTATPPTFSDTTGSNSWSVPTNVYQQNTLSQVFCSMAYAKVATTGATFKVTGTLPATFTAKSSLVVAEFSGVALSSPQDGTAVGTTQGSSTSFSIGNMTVSAGSLTLANVVNSDGTTNVTLGTPANFTLVANQTNSAGSIGIGQAAYGIGLTSPTNPNWTDANGGSWAGSQFALLAAGAASGKFKPAWVRQGITLGMGIYERMYDWKRFFRPNRRILLCS